MKQALDKLKPNNWIEVATATVLLSSALSGLTLFVLSWGDRDISVEPHMLGMGLAAVIFVVVYRQQLINTVWNSPWRWLLAWLLLGFGVAFIKTESTITTLQYSLYAVALFVSVVGVFRGIKTGEIRKKWLIDLWLKASIGLALVAIVQFILGALTDWSVLHESYKVGVFAFPRVHGFALEPLFFTNWLLPAVFYFTLNKSQPRLLAVLLVTVLFLSMARGAVYAVILTLGVYLVFNRGSWRPNIKRFSIIFATSLLIALIMVGVSASLNNRTFSSGVGRYLDHTSLGLFNYSGANNIKPTIKYIDGKRYEIYSSVRGLDREGVVEASTLGRIEVIKLGLDIYDNQPSNVLVGVGLHRFGQESVALSPDTYTDEQVSNNQYIEILVETGIIGFGLIAWLFAAVYRAPLRSQDQWLRWAFMAMALQFLFFSNYLVFMPWFVVALIMGYSKKYG